MPMMVKFYSYPENPENPENPDSDRLYTPHGHIFGFLVANMVGKLA